MTGPIPYADMKVGDLVEVNTVTVHSGKVVEIDSRFPDNVLIEGPTHRDWVYVGPLSIPPYPSVISAHDRRVILVNRPEPPKPAAKVGDKLTTDHAEPPVGAVVIRESTPLGVPTIRRRDLDGWRRISGDHGAEVITQWGRPKGGWDRFLTPSDYMLIYIPSE